MPRPRAACLLTVTRRHGRRWGTPCRGFCRVKPSPMRPPPRVGSVAVPCTEGRAPCSPCRRRQQKPTPAVPCRTRRYVVQLALVKHGMPHAEEGMCTLSSWTLMRRGRVKVVG